MNDTAAHACSCGTATLAVGCRAPQAGVPRLAAAACWQCSWPLRVFERTAAANREFDEGMSSSRKGRDDSMLLICSKLDCHCSGTSLGGQEAAAQGERVLQALEVAVLLQILVKLCVVGSNPLHDHNRLLVHLLGLVVCPAAGPVLAAVLGGAGGRPPQLGASDAAALSGAAAANVGTVDARVLAGVWVRHDGDVGGRVGQGGLAVHSAVLDGEYTPLVAVVHQLVQRPLQNQSPSLSVKTLYCRHKCDLSESSIAETATQMYKTDVDTFLCTLEYYDVLHVTFAGRRRGGLFAVPG
mmetsp:Transcript_5861/g.16729  ORF Transcript_5861/g.16729 Transcript_5861/m.16729 type:complete len:297 (+) Transcript_5861:643-1533(+)